MNNLKFIKYWWINIAIETRYLGMFITIMMCGGALLAIFGHAIAFAAILIGISSLISFGVLHTLYTSVTCARAKYNEEQEQEALRIVDTLNGVSRSGNGGSPI